VGKKGMSKGVRSMHFHVHIVLIKDCVQVINKPCVRDARYVRLISWTLRCGSEQNGSLLFSFSVCKLSFSVSFVFCLQALLENTSRCCIGAFKLEFEVVCVLPSA
jgi:hypothetical protein